MLSSVSEGQPFAILEGMAAKRPYVSTNVGSCRELLEGNDDEFGKAGEIVPVMNPNLMAKAILRIAENRDKMREMAMNGYKRVVKYYQEEDFLFSYRKQYFEFASEEEKKRLIYIMSRVTKTRDWSRPRKMQLAKAKKKAQET